jgi:hypothetical protein
MVNAKYNRSSIHRPGKAVCISRAARMSYRFFEELRSGSQAANCDFRLPSIGSTNHTWMFAIDSKFLIRNGIGKCRSPGEGFVSFAEFTGHQQRVAQRPVSHGKLRLILVVIG